MDHSNGRVLSGGTTHKGEISRKEKDFFGDPTQWRHGRAWYERIWPQCPKEGDVRVGIDATPAYHVWYDAPKNMVSFFGSEASARLRLVWLLRDPVAKYWSYFWELKSYGGEWDRVHFGPWTAPKLNRTRECQAADPASPLWPPSLPPPFDNCAPHLDHGLYEPQLRRWLEFFHPSQLLLVSFAGMVRRPMVVLGDVLLHAGLRPAEAARTVASAAGAPPQPKKLNSRARGKGQMPPQWRAQVRALYQPFVDRLYKLIDERGIAVSPCEEKGTRFLDPLLDAELPPHEGAVATTAAPEAVAATPRIGGKRGGSNGYHRAPRHGLGLMLPWRGGALRGRGVAAAERGRDRHHQGRLREVMPANPMLN